MGTRVMIQGRPKPGFPKQEEVKGSYDNASLSAACLCDCYTKVKVKVKLLAPGKNADYTHSTNTVDLIFTR
jgi:hypothetical protein